MRETDAPEVVFVLADAEDGSVLACARSIKEEDTFWIFCPGESSNDKQERWSAEIPHDLRRHSPYYLGRIDKDMTGSKLSFWDYGYPKSSNFPSGLVAYEERIRCQVHYDPNILASKPNTMRVQFAKGSSCGNLQPDGAQTEGPGSGAVLMQYDACARPCLLSKQNSQDSVELVTQKPEWDEKLQGWTMKFHGRVHMSSKKNFILVDRAEPQHELMLFGKISKSIYALDFASPLSPSLALFVALTTFIKKMAAC
jgi:hypothetical protein